MTRKGESMRAPVMAAIPSAAMCEHAEDAQTIHLMRAGA